MTEYLTFEDALTLIRDLRVGPVNDPGLLDSALHRPRSTVFGDEAYPGLAQKAAALLESLVVNHPLLDGNKRLGWLATVVFLGLNGVALDAPDDDAYDLVINVAQGRARYQQIAQRLSEWMQLPSDEP